jgi:predicted phage-related endonuclease
LIGGSDAGALLGLDSYRSPVNVFYAALDLSLKKFKNNVILMMGKILENQIAELWESWVPDEDQYVKNVESGVKVKLCEERKFIIQNPDYPALFANVDRFIMSHPVYKKKEGILEIKTINSRQSDMYALGFPPKYVIQAQTYMMITGLEYAEIAFLKDGRELNVRTFEADADTHRVINEAANLHKDRVTAAVKAIFDYTHDVAQPETADLISIASQFEPPADATTALADFLSERHRLKALEVRMEGNEEHLDWAIRYKQACADIKTAEDEKQYAANQLKSYMLKYNAAILELPGDNNVTWRKMFKVNVNL